MHYELHVVASFHPEEVLYTPLVAEHGHGLGQDAVQDLGDLVHGVAGRGLHEVQTVSPPLVVDGEQFELVCVAVVRVLLADRKSVV